MSEIWPKIFVVGGGEEPRMAALSLATTLRSALFEKRQSMGVRSMPCIEACVDGNLKKQLEKANKNGASHVVIIRDGDIAAIKDMSTGDQRDMPSAYLGDEFGRLMGERFSRLSP